MLARCTVMTRCMSIMARAFATAGDACERDESDLRRWRRRRLGAEHRPVDVRARRRHRPDVRTVVHRVHAEVPYRVHDRRGLVHRGVFLQESSMAT